MKERNKQRPDVLGDRMKQYEAITTGTTLIPNLPVYARIDGRAFHTLTKGLKKPYDITFVSLMMNVAKTLVKETNAKLAFVQSDEISLGWEDYTKAPFEGKLFKLQSILSSIATASFYRYLVSMEQEKEQLGIEGTDLKSLRLLTSKAMGTPVTFDCRVFNVPSMVELANAFLWRENDATRNSISGLAQANFSHKQLQGKSSKDMIEMLEEKGIYWNELPSSLKRGTYFRRVNITRTLTDEEWDRIPEGKKPDSREVIRSVIEPLDLPIMKSIVNKVDVYFNEAEPIDIKECL